MKNKTRLDIAVFERKLSDSRTKAQSLIMGGCVFVNGEIKYKSDFVINDQDVIKIKNNHPYVSRGGVKLESALNKLAISVNGCTCLDIGASTGGFTDCLLQKGAIKVYAVDVGHGQLHYKLRKDKRVANIENVNFRYFNTSLLKETIDFVTIDCSFISLDKILPTALKCIGKNGLILAMIKPQFELSKNEVQKGVVRDEKLRQKAIRKIVNFAQSLGFFVVSQVDSELKGQKGNLEHFVLLKKIFCI
ncbi:MAG: TlyA family RNA methyltransferase [Elusimicrobiota bacterium]|nr:TlyA family RNA methyltransferase [Elusimicrobiota bacterium]